MKFFNKKNNKRLNHFFLPSDQRLFDYDQIFSVSSMWVELGMENVESTYDLFVRGMPKNRNFLLFGGLEEILESIRNWKFTRSEIRFLLENNVITKKMAKLLRNFKFRGDIFAMKEGTVFFPGEPVVRLSGKIWEVNLFTFFLMNALTSNSIFLSKIVRSTLAANGKMNVITCPVTRAHANEASLKFGRAAYILGSPAALVPGFARKFNLPMNKAGNTKAYHAFINSFPSEIEAMRAAASIFPTIGLMIDTYDFKQGLRNAIIVAKETKLRTGKNLSAIVIDSGKDVADYVRQTKYVRNELDKAGLKEIKINVTGNFDENRIQEFIKLGGPADNVIACTDLITSSDDPKMEAVLKISEFIQDSKIFPCAKLTPGKESYPGKKQVFRVYKDGKINHDVIGLENEELGFPLLHKMVSKGKLIYDHPSLDEIKDYTKGQLDTLPEELKEINKVVELIPKVSRKLNKMLDKCKEIHQSKIE
jgi:nicotinate phosphoribosyltransferase